MATPAAFFSILLSAGAVALLVGVSQARASEGSSAVAAVASFDQGLEATRLGQIGTASGSGPKAYRVVTRLASAKNSMLLQSGPLPLPQMITGLSGLMDVAWSAGLGVDSIRTQADSSIDSASVLLTGYQCPPCALPLVNYLSVQATGVASRSSFTFVAPASYQPGGSAAIASLTITGQLVGGKTLTFSGSAPPNTILYEDGATEDDSTIVIRLDRQQETGTVAFCAGGPASSCPFTPSDISTTAIHVRLHGALVAGVPVTGDIEIGRTHAE